MGSEDQVLNLMRLLDNGIKEAEQIEDKLDSYDRILAVSFFFVLSHDVRVALKSTYI